MNFTAQNASRKWAYGAFRRIEPAMVTVAAVALLLGMPAGPAMIDAWQRLMTQRDAVLARANRTTMVRADLQPGEITRLDIPLPATFARRGSRVTLRLLAAVR